MRDYLETKFNTICIVNLFRVTHVIYSQKVSINVITNRMLMSEIGNQLRRCHKRMHSRIYYFWSLVFINSCIWITFMYFVININRHKCPYIYGCDSLRFPVIAATQKKLLYFQNPRNSGKVSGLRFISGQLLAIYRYRRYARFYAENFY